MAAAQITTARLAIWTAIRNHDALRDGSGTIWRREYDYEDRMRGQDPDNVSAADLPSIQISYSAGTPDWFSNRQVGLNTVLEVRVQYPHWKVSPVETIFEELIKAVWQDADARCHLDTDAGNLGSFTLTPLSEPQRLELLWLIPMRPLFDPTV